MATAYERNKRWRKRHPGKWQACKRRYYRQFLKNCQNSRCRWTSREIELITCENKLADRFLSQILGRSVEAIQVKRHGIRNSHSVAN